MVLTCAARHSNSLQVIHVDRRQGWYSRVQHVPQRLPAARRAAGLPAAQAGPELRQVGQEALVLLAGQAHLGHHEAHASVRPALQVLLGPRSVYIIMMV